MFILSLIAILTVGVDPYDMWMHSRCVGFNYYAIRSENRERLFKPVHVIANKPDVLFLGNSKADFGLDPNHYAEITGVDNVYNIAIRNVMPYEMRRLTEMALINNRDLKTIVLAVDFEMFITPDASMPGFDEEQANAAHITANNVLKTTVSWDAIKDSLITIKKNRDNMYDYPTYEKNGKLSDGALHDIFSDEASFFKNTRAFIIDQYKYANVLDEGIYEEKFKDIERIVKLCRERGVELKVIVPPVHAIHLNAYAQNWLAYENWVRRLVEIVPFTSFNQYNSITMSELSDSAEDNIYFWDSAHMKANVGDMVLDYLFGQDDDNIPVAFVFEVNSKTVDEYLEYTKGQNKEWLDSNKDIHDELASVGKFTSICPTTLKSSKLVLNDFIDNSSLTEVKCEDQILSFEGKINLETDEIKILYAVLENRRGNTFYAMANKKWRNDNIGISAMFRGNNEAVPYEFLCAAITGSIPDGVYSLKLIGVLKNNDDIYISPELKSVYLTAQ